MQKETIVTTVNDFLVDEFEVDAATIIPDADLKETLDLDSLDYVDLVVVVESNFGVKLTEPDFKAIRTFQDFYDLIETKMKVNA
ncbi:MAG: acyl carrier protein [Capnocytophaga sp.]|nr:acyl carrier protein [Capnocytophaga sp.]